MIDHRHGNSPLSMGVSMRLLILGAAIAFLWLAVVWATQ
jgi:hypothetical protein